jgi:hypothetical protein
MIYHMCVCVCVYVCVCVCAMFRSGGVAVSEEDPSVAAMAGSMSHRQEESGGQWTAGNSDVGIAVCREGYGTAGGHAMAGVGIFSAEFVFERGPSCSAAAYGAVVGIVRSDYDLLDDHLSRGGVPVLPLA